MGCAQKNTHCQANLLLFVLKSIWREGSSSVKASSECISPVGLSSLQLRTTTLSIKFTKAVYTISLDEKLRWKFLSPPRMNLVVSTENLPAQKSMTAPQESIEMFSNSV